ncbi:hypothetical protein ABVT39_021533 [Epinephelus coioides]
MDGKEDSRGITVHACFDKSNVKTEIVLWLTHCVPSIVNVYIPEQLIAHPADDPPPLSSHCRRFASASRYRKQMALHAEWCSVHGTCLVAQTQPHHRTQLCPTASPTDRQI